jgi:hypothetical protein
MKKCYEGVHDLILKINNPRLLIEFSRAFEMYVEKLFRIPAYITFLSEHDIKKIIKGKNADFVIEFEKSIFIVECKASKLSSKVVTKNALLDDNITNKIADSFIQIIHTALDINQGNINLLPKKDKKIIGLCIIFGEMEFANSKEYISNYVLQKMNPQDLELFKNSPLSFNPQILSISSLEDLIMISVKYYIDLDQIILEKVQIPYEKYGDWPTYLLQLNKDNIDLSLPFEKDVLNNFHNGIINVNNFD